MVKIYRYMKLFSARVKSNKKGFTLIELLVVIGILGILAAALVATIDPFEQLKKANDAKVQNILVEYINSVTRYYTTHNAYPWDSTANGGGNCNSAAVPTKLALATSVASDCVTVVQADNELKQAFSSDTSDLAKIFVTYDSVNNAVIGCYAPQSKSVQNNANTKYDKNGAADGTKACGTNSDTNGCYWCTR
jgi:prepilin-type N-terminal cleavage/methylation domain-containing protein